MDGQLCLHVAAIAAPSFANGSPCGFVFFAMYACVYEFGALSWKYNWQALCPVGVRSPCVCEMLGNLTFYFVFASRTICAASCVAFASISFAIVSRITFSWLFVNPSSIPSHLLPGIFHLAALLCLYYTCCGCSIAMQKESCPQIELHHLYFFARSNKRKQIASKMYTIIIPNHLLHHEISCAIIGAQLAGIAPLFAC